MPQTSEVTSDPNVLLSMIAHTLPCAEPVLCYYSMQACQTSAAHAIIHQKGLPVQAKAMKWQCMRQLRGGGVYCVKMQYEIEDALIGRERPSRDHVLRGEAAEGSRKQ